MKPARIKAESERTAKVQLRRYARSIPNNAKLINIALQYDPVFRSEWYRRIKPFLRFQPVPLETINAIVQG